MKNQADKKSRRSFLKTALAAGAAPWFVPAAALGKAGRPAPSNRLTLGLVGLGSMGMRHLQGFVLEDDCQVVAVCDVDAARRATAVKDINAHYGNRDCAQYNDYRELLGRDDLDTLCIAVPDHWHAIPAIEAVRAGKDVYGEKPLALTVDEGKQVVRAVRRYGAVFQTGSWQRSTAHFRFACELVRNGRIGKLQKVEVSINVSTALPPQPVMPVPQGFDYDRWLGPAPPAPYTEQRCHWNFRWNLDYSGGQVTDWGCHHVDIAQWGMGTDETGPVEIEGKGRFPGEGLWNTATEYRFQCRYADGLVLSVFSDAKRAPFVRWTGEDGWVHVNRAKMDVHDKTLLREKFDPGEIHLKRPAGDHRQGHRRDFLDCVKTRSDPITPAEIGHRSATICHLGNIAMLLGRRVHWDPARQQILHDPQAARLLKRPMRSPYRIS